MKTLIRTLAVFGVLAIAGRASFVGVYWDFQPNGGALALPTEIFGGTIVGMNQYGTNNPGFSTGPDPSTGYTGVNGGASGNHNANIAIMGGSTLDTAASTYFEFTLAPAAGMQIYVDSFEVGSFSTSLGPTNLTLLSNADGYTTPLWTGTTTNTSTWSLVTGTWNISLTAPVDASVTFRLYGWNGTGGDNNANWLIDDVTLGVVAVPEPPTYAAMLVGGALLGMRAWRRRKSPVA